MKKGLRAVRASIVGAASLALPLSTFAAGTNIKDIVLTIKSLMDLGIPILITLALIYFLYGLAEYIFKANDVDTRTEGRERMIQGIIALFVMSTVWGLVGVISNTFNVQPEGVDNALINDLVPRAPGQPQTGVGGTVR